MTGDGLSPAHLEHIWNNAGLWDVLYNEEERIHPSHSVGARLSAIFSGFIDQPHKSPV